VKNLLDICPDHKAKINLWNSCLDESGKIAKNSKIIGDYIRKKREKKKAEKEAKKAGAITI
jgi:hypothetical protein